jgi:tetratricopeptide (TPR) repeat protein
MAPVSRGHEWVERTFGVLINTPMVWFALAGPLAWRNRSKTEISILLWFLSSVVLLVVVSALNLSLLPDAYLRYEVEFLPELVFLAVVGILALERQLADRPRRRSMMGWGLLLGLSVSFNLLASIEQCAEAHNAFGIGLVQMGRLPDAIDQYERALLIKPDLAEAESNLGNALAEMGQRQEALGHYVQALQLKPEDAEAHNNLAVDLMGLGRFQEAIEQYQQAIRIKPDYIEAQFNLGLASEMTGRVPEAIEHYQRALRLKPDLTEARTALARLQAHP